jgi:8-oxo-dGTP diphosphatase
MKYRICARGILKENGRILFVEYSDKQGKTYFSLPGGGQEKGITLTETLVMEFKEEAGIEVEAGDVVLVREFIIDDPDTDTWKGGIHQVEIIFECRRIETANKKYDFKPDTGMIGIKWIPVDDLDSFKIYPCKEINEIVRDKRVSYLFDRD